MSSHREAPAISKDAVADSTDLYAFVSPDDPSTVTIIANYLPGEAPFGGPNFYEFGDDVLYRINIDNDADGKPEIVYEFQFSTEISNKATFLYNVGPITSLDSATWIRKQFYTVTRVEGGKRTVLGIRLACPPCNIGPGSTSNTSPSRPRRFTKWAVGTPCSRASGSIRSTSTSARSSTSVTCDH